MCGLDIKMNEKQQKADSTTCVVLSSFGGPGVKCCGQAAEDHYYHFADLSQRQKPPAIHKVLVKLLPRIHSGIERQMSKPKAQLLHPFPVT